MKQIFFKVVPVLALLFMVSCDRTENCEMPLDGLWMGPFNETVDKLPCGMVIDIQGTNAELYNVVMGEDGGFFAETRNSAKVSYDAGKMSGFMAAGEGRILFSFEISESGAMLTSTRKILTRSNRSINDLFGSGLLKENYLSMPDKSFTGVESFSRTIPVPPVVPNLMESFLSWLGPIVARTAVTYGCNALFNDMFGSAEVEKLDEIMSAIDDLNDALSDLTELYHNTTYETYLNKRLNDYVAPLKNYNNYYFTLLENCDGSDEAIKQIAVEWGDGTIGGNKACMEYLNFIDFLTKSVVERKNLYQIYDLYVYNTTPWEEQGYAIREGLRSADLAVIAQSMMLAEFYYRLKDGLNDGTRESMLTVIKTAKDNYEAFAKANPVERHDDMAICQIKGAHFAMKRQLVERDYYNKPWFPNGSQWDNENNESAWVVTYGDTYYNCAEIYKKCLTQAEVEAIAAYYKPQGITRFLDILTGEAKCILPAKAEGKTAVMLCQGDGYTEHDEYDDYMIYASKAVLASSNSNVGRQNIGIAYLEHYGFLWMSQRFTYWTSSFDRNHFWFRTDVVQRN